MTSNFDSTQLLENEISLLNIERFLSTFENEEITTVGIKNIFNFDSKEFDKIKAKLKEMKDVGMMLKDKDVLSFFDERIKVILTYRIIKFIIFKYL